VDLHGADESSGRRGRPQDTAVAITDSWPLARFRAYICSSASAIN
jgi:hypothetical protein